jgi:hypothetical protein
MKIACALLVLAGAAGASLAHAQGDPLKSPECGSALAALQSARFVGAAPAAVEGLRSAAAGSCLGSAVVPSRPSRIAQQPITVPPPQIDVPPGPAPSLAPAPMLPPPVAIGRPPLPSQCDAGGCWSSDGGTHLRHVPPTLVGPNGMCTQQGGVVYCP